MRKTARMTSASDDLVALAGALPEGWSVGQADERDATELTDLVRRHEHHARGWASSSPEGVRMELSGAGRSTRQNVVARDARGDVRGWGSAHDRAAGRMLLRVVVDPGLADDTADRVADLLFGWGAAAARRVGATRGLATQQTDSGAFAGDRRQHAWLSRHGFTQVRTWWQMSRPVTPDDAEMRSGTRAGVRIRLVQRQDDGMPSEHDLRIVHDVLETSFEDHFNSHEETFDEFVSRLRADPGHRWDHWWIAELVDGEGDPVPAGALVASVSGTGGGPAEGSYVEYIGVLQSARGRGVATSLLRTVIADAAVRHRDRVGLEVDADSPTRADALYTSMGWRTVYVTESWHKDVPVPAPPVVPAWA
jgi:GNAT superfamily N-acetyltransferase